MASKPFVPDELSSSVFQWFRSPRFTRLYDFPGFGARYAPNLAFSLTFALLQAPNKPPRESPRESPRTSERCARLDVFPIFVILGGRRVQIGKFNNWGGLIIEGGGYTEGSRFS